MTALEPTSAGRRGPELQGTWQCVDARPTICLDLRLVCRGTQSVGYQQTRKKLLVRNVLLIVAPLGGVGAGDLGAPTINAKKRRRRGPWEVLTEIRERPPSM
jgi:hypothetical protein